MPQSPSREKKQEWEENFRKQRESGLSIKSWCQVNQITTQAFYYWRIRLFPKPDLNRTCFTELSDSKDIGITLECNGIHVSLDEDFDSSVLKRCLAVLKEVKC